MCGVDTINKASKTAAGSRVIQAHQRCALAAVAVRVAMAGGPARGAALSPGRPRCGRRFVLYEPDDAAWPAVKPVRYTGRSDTLFSLRENAIAKEPGLSYPERWRCVSRLGASMVAQIPASLPRIRL